MPSAPRVSHPLDVIRKVSSPLGGLAGLLKIVFYIVAALALAFGIWKYRHQLLQALADILRQLRELFGGRGAGAGAQEEESPARARVPSFADFQDPFMTGKHNQMSPEELVRYTFSAFEAWANDRGRPRTPDCTPQELIRMAVEPQTPLYDESRRLVRMYGEVAYASRQIPRDAASQLSELWHLMRSSQFSEFAGTRREQTH
jgi:hypothetical protein